MTQRFECALLQSGTDANNRRHDMADTTFITRFDIFARAGTEDEDGRQVVRMFAKRKLIGEFDTEDCTRYPEGFDHHDFTAWLVTGKGGKGRTVGQAMDYLGSDPEDDEGEDDEPASIVPEKYRILYGAAQNCGDAIALALTAFVTLPRAKANEDGGLDRAKLRAVAEANGIGDRLARWEDDGRNGGLLRMNTSNVLRGMNRRGEEVRIGDRVWPARDVAKKPRAKRTSKAKSGKAAK